MKDYYKILQVPPDATIAEIKTAFRKLARQYHPDLNPDNRLAEEEFKIICEAYEMLSDRAQRQLYDRDVDVSQSRERAMNPYDYYVKGVEKTLKQDYQGAIESYTQAIDLKPNFVEAYIKRGEVRYKQGNDRGVLEDCSQALEIDPEYAEAYYYQGRARYRLGYSQSAIEAYSHALRLEAYNAQFYYHRAIAYHDLEERDAAKADFKKAVELFKAQGDVSGYRLAQETLKRLNSKWRKFLPFKLLDTSVKALGYILSHPHSGLAAVYAKLDEREAIAVGLVFAAIAAVNVLLRPYFGFWQLPLPGLELSLVVWVPFVGLVLLSAIARFLARRSGSWGGDILLSGATLLPISLLPMLGGFGQSFSLLVTPAILFVIVTLCYGMFILYGGCLQLLKLPEWICAIAIPLLLFLAGWMSLEAPINYLNLIFHID
ncbi:DnaJ domain-containing protein [Lusitaniella coriacea LEGE 07157]|uniref:DnaJ domain-containing protein n=1 Tax=Lusitaniella coriacea LEGE 07157 TaxID=945747 RepID=A0A8J7DZ53_9CYAN|nr:Yip1 family protein [Lusitaniella coriacea]MBE9117987.1 DnaJ domain-containing protein [Lusitaniella coriacea LEGE 07157]